MYQITVVPADGPSYEELEDKAARLEGKLIESRRGRYKAERFAVASLIMFAVSTTLLALTWGGVIVI